MPWRRGRTPYRILVSEVMLQQTGTDRVAGKYGKFLAAFPSMRSLANARLQDVLAAWKGLGYNRRALFLKRTAEVLVIENGGKVPRSIEELSALPGIGRATACSILAFAFDAPVAFIETNIRRVFIHFFFPGAAAVSDAQILPLVEKMLDKKNPREWYYALMDYGAMLKGIEENPNRRSLHYKRQAAFEGSIRQVRGLVLSALLTNPGATRRNLAASIGERQGALDLALEQLTAEGFLRRKGGRFSIQ